MTRTAQAGPETAVAQVETYFELFGAGDLDAFLALLDPEVRFMPIAEAGTVLHGREEIRRFIEDASLAGRRLEPHALRLVPHGDRVVVVGSLRQRRFGALHERTGAWVFELRDGLIAAIDGYISPDEAFRAAQSG